MQKFQEKEILFFFLQRMLKQIMFSPFACNSPNFFILKWFSTTAPPNGNSTCLCRSSPFQTASNQIKKSLFAANFFYPRQLAKTQQIEWKTMFKEIVRISGFVTS